MQIIVLASQKGGSGKTTLSGHLAVEAEKMGAGPVALIDTDPQASLSHWWNARGASAPAFARIAIDELEEGLDHLRQSGFRLAIIDTPPAITHSISRVVSFADLVVIPARPSPHDLRAVGATIDIAEAHRKPLIFVMNAATVRARITGEAAVALSQHGTVAPITLHHRVDYAASMVDGRTIGEVDPKSKSAQEISELWAYIANRLVRMNGAMDVEQKARAAELGVRPLSPLGSSAPEAEVEEEESVLVTVAEERYFSPTPPPMPQATATESVSPIGFERRNGEERRKNPEGRPPAGMPERRMTVFGRRNADRAPQPGFVEKRR
ncbi:AAA family ATPase [Parvibaculum sedimenti]|uniref:AAA family ATPase n=1 Tax=Parvibaculum sedimenti TaxID=2608632 RepID=A0A6N6VS54_9HYPH|nr:ParA family protein [Parvibaculum sedimenti]KAB7742283.1 AAA family ATPase [Parvibaculum sedimenti]